MRLARSIAVLTVVLAVLAPAFAASAVKHSGAPESCHGVGIDAITPAIATSHASMHADSAGPVCGLAACAISGCMAAALPAFSASMRHHGTVLAVRLDAGDQFAAGIGASPGLRPPIDAVET